MHPSSGVSLEKPAREQANAFIDVRHEVGLRDWVVMLAAAIRPITKRVGPAGRRGFTVDSPVVHDRCTWKVCTECVTGIVTRVHNFRQNSPHWISLFEKGYPREIWLPYLWGYEPFEYECYRLLCETGREAVAAGHDYRAWRVENAFRKQVWTWTENKPCEDYLTVVAGHHYKKKGLPLPDPAGLEEMQKAAIHWIWLMNAAAHGEWSKAKQQRNDDVIRKMEPEWLFNEAVKRAVNG